MFEKNSLISTKKRERMLPLVRGARYWHYKGLGPYTLIELGSRTSDLKVQVIYRQDYESKTHPVGHIWVRDLTEFESTVETKDGPKPRFTKE